MSDVYLVLFGMGIGLTMRVIMAALDVAIHHIEKEKQ